MTFDVLRPDCTAKIGEAGGGVNGFGNFFRKTEEEGDAPVPGRRITQKQAGANEV